MALLPVYQIVRLSRMMKEITECGASLIVAGPKPFQKASTPSPFISCPACIIQFACACAFGFIREAKQTRERASAQQLVVETR